MHSLANASWNPNPRPRMDIAGGRDLVLGDVTPWLDVWRRGTQRARRLTPEVRVDIGYGRRESERFDLYLPNHRPRNLPFVAFVHGGGWHHSLRAESGYPAKAFHHQGAAFAVIGYEAGKNSQ